jgi:hypothetical protein
MKKQNDYLPIHRKHMSNAKLFLVCFICLGGITGINLSDPELIYSVSESSTQTAFWDLMNIRLVEAVGIVGYFIVYISVVIIFLLLFIRSIILWLDGEKKDLNNKKDILINLPQPLKLIYSMQIIIPLCSHKVAYSIHNVLLIFESFYENKFEYIVNQEYKELEGYKSEEELNQWYQFSEDFCEAIYNNDYYYFEVIDERVIEMVKKWEKNPGFEFLRKLMKDKSKQDLDFKLIDKMSEIGFDKEWLKHLYYISRWRKMKKSQDYWFSKKKEFKIKKRIPYSNV